MTDYDAIVLGGGINGFAAAIALARGTARVLLIDRRAEAGGTLAPAEPVGLYGPATLSPRLMHELDLARHGLVLAPFGGIAAVNGEGPAFLLPANALRARKALARLDKGEPSRFERLCTEMMRVRTLMAPMFDVDRHDPLGLKGTDAFGEMLAHGGRLGAGAVYDVMNLASTSLAERLESDLRTEALRVTLAAAALSGQAQGPMTPGSAFSLAFLPFWERGAARLAFGGTPIGGFAALSGALAQAARAAGVTVQMGAEVEHIHVEEGRVTGVVLGSGEEIHAPCVLSSLDAKRTVGALLDWTEVPENLSRRIARMSVEGTVARLRLTVSALDFLPTDLRALKPAAIYLASSLGAMDRAGDDAAFGCIPETPWLDISVPSLAEPGADPNAPAHMMVSIHHTPWRLETDGWNDERRGFVLAHVLEAMEIVWPGFLGRVKASRLWLPMDIEERSGLTGGHLMGGDLGPDRLFYSRPAPELCGYRTPVEGLYLCGRDAHAQGSGLSGVAAARTAMADLGGRTEPRKQAKG